MKDNEEDLQDELPETDGDSDNFELLPEGQEYVAKVDFKSIIFRQYDRTARSATAGDPVSFSNGVSILKGLTAPYRDKRFEEKMKELDEKYESIMEKLTADSQDDDSTKGTNNQIAQHFQSEKLVEIFEEVGMLLKRQGIIK